MAKFPAFTGKGDDGTTCLMGPGRYSKSGLRFEVLGTLDECSANIGLAKSMILDAKIKQTLTHIQRDLYHIMAEVSKPPNQNGVPGSFSPERIQWLESEIEVFGAQIPSPGGFIIPGDTREDAVLDVARTIVRRAERNMVELLEQDGNQNPILGQYLNRLSSLIFTLELAAHQNLSVSAQTMAKE